MAGYLDNAIDALRAEGEHGGDSPRLSDAVRASIVQAAWAESSDRAGSFRPASQRMRWLVVAGIAPVVLVVLASILPPPRDGGAARPGPAFVGAEKIGGAVVFTIADGRDPHRVVKSTDAARFNASASQSVIDGRFLDRVNSGPVVVFYRID